ncbi:MAG: NUDIX domain-containing protein [Ferruginibacter sp.]
MELVLSVRVYGILINDARQVLVSDEYIRGSYYTKFPGGGLEIGEGTRDCLKREFKEEMNLEVAIGDHIYTTDFFQQSAFNSAHQILSVYYFAIPLEEIKVPLRDKEFDFDDQQLQLYSHTQQIETFRFVEWEKFSADIVTLPIDKIAATMVKKNS